MQLNSKGVPIVDPDETDPLLPLSALFLWTIEMKFIKFARFIALIGAFIILTVDASSNPYSVHGLVDIIYLLDYIVNIYYIFDGGLKMLSMYSYLAIAKNCSQSITATTYFRRSGIVDVPLSALSLVYSYDTSVNKWLHLMRCAALSLFFLEQTPQIDVLMVRSLLLCRFVPCITLCINTERHNGWSEIHSVHVVAYGSYLSGVRRHRSYFLQAK